MADEGDSLSDAQLREQLKLHGVKHGPITASTRAILLKKLDALKSGTGSPSHKDKAKKRRSVATSTPSKQKTKLSGFSSEEDEFPVRKTASLDSPSAASRRRSALPRVAYVKREDNDSDSSSVDERVAAKAPPGRRRSLPRTYVRETRSLETIPSVAKSFANDSPALSKDGEVEHIERRPNYRKNSFDLEEEGQLIVKRTSVAEAVKRSSPIKPASHNSVGNDKKTVTTSSRLISTTLKRHIRKDETLEDQTDAARIEGLSKDAVQDSGQDDEELELAFASNSSFFKNWRGPAFTIFVAVLLVCLIGSYVSLWSNRLSEWPALPDLKDDSSMEKVNKEQVFKVLQCLHEKLALYAGEKECGYPNVSTSMNGDQLGLVLSQQCSSTFKEKLIDYDNLAVKVVNLAVDKKYSKFFSIKDKRGNKNEKVAEGTLYKITLSSKIAVKPFTCRLKEAAQILSKYIFGILLGLGIMLGVYYVMKRRWMMDDEDTRLMFIFVERIIETLRRHHDACQHDKELPPYLPIPHVRDMLIPPRERQYKARAWKKAVDFLSSTDSRIRVETQRISGEDFDVWRWIGVMTSNKHVKGASNHLGPEDERGKFWQGPAFDKLEKVVRMPIITPTPCLKIRYLHGGPAEKEESWDRQVRDALLEKCNEDGAKILHVFVDVKSPEGCVYVKCDSLESAGRAFRSVYGNWFDGRLVIVKFVTVARYHQRFPDALACDRPLVVSGDFQSSLSWNNPEEMTEQTKKQS